MREILFRGKRLSDGEWVQGDLLQDPDLGGVTISWFGYDVFEHGIERWETSESVVPETVGQYTGLTDKNGKKIFEGDIVRYYHSVQKPIYDEETGVVSGYKTSRVIRYKGYVTINELGVEINLSNNCQWWRHKNGNQLARVEVIGNVHDNPELLKGE